MQLRHCTVIRDI